MANIDKAYQWVINMCNARNVGYSQTYRRGQFVNGITYYDCSSLISQALTMGGFFPPNKNPWFTTQTMGKYLIDLGFKEYPTTVAWQAGDILLNKTRGHTEMCYRGGLENAGGVTMGAHSADRPLDEQVSINTKITKPSYYEKLYRFGAPAIPMKWIYGNRYLSEEEKKNNAYVFFSYMYYKNFTLNAIAGMLGNIEQESTINPALWQNLDYGNYKLGYGLVQWTPATNYTNWATGKGYDITDGFAQCEWLDTETDKSQWIKTRLYPITFDEFRESKQTPEYLASAFLKNFERAGVEVEDKRRKDARKWYDYLSTLSPKPPIPPTPTGNKRKLPLYFYLFP